MHAAKHDDDQQRYDAYFVLMKLPISKCVVCVVYCLFCRRVQMISTNVLLHSLPADKTLVFIGILAQAVAINIGHGKEETDRASSSLRGFKKLDHIIEKLHWTTHKSGYQHWNNGQGNGRDRKATSDYLLTEKELIDTALASKQAATSAYELADAAANEDSDAIKEAVGKLKDAAYLAKAEAELACALLPTESEEGEEDKQFDIDNLLQNVSNVPAIANAIANEAKKTAGAAELAVVAINAPNPDKKFVSAVVRHTKRNAEYVASIVDLLMKLMNSNAGSGPNVN